MVGSVLAAVDSAVSVVHDLADLGTIARALEAYKEAVPTASFRREPSPSHRTPPHTSRRTPPATHHPPRPPRLHDWKSAGSLPYASIFESPPQAVR